MTQHERLHLIVLEAAFGEIVDQANYFQEHSGRELADRWGTAVQDTVQSLRTMADRGQPCAFLSTQLRELRRISVAGFERYSVYYNVSADAKTLMVVAVLHSARDIDRILETLRT